MRRLKRLGQLVKWEQLQFWRNPPAAFFTFVFTILFLVIFATLSSGDKVGPPGRKVPFVQYYVPAIVAFGVIQACYTGLAFTMSIRREAGILKRKRGTPLSAVDYMAGVIGSNLVVATILSALVTVIGVVFYDVRFPGRYLGLILTLAIGAACFSALGMACSAFVPNEEAAPAIINATMFPLVFISGTFGPVKADSFLSKIAIIFPVRHFLLGTVAVFDPFASGTGVVAKRLLVMGIWTVAGVAVAVWKFRWEPRNT